LILSLINTHINITSQKFSSTPFHLLFIILYSLPRCDSTPVLPGYLLLRHFFTWDKTSIFWSCHSYSKDRFWAIIWWVNFLLGLKMVSYLPSDGLRKNSVGAFQEIVKARMPTITKQALRYELVVSHMWTLTNSHKAYR